MMIIATQNQSLIAVGVRMVIKKMLAPILLKMMLSKAMVTLIISTTVIAVMTFKMKLKNLSKTKSAKRRSRR